MNTMECPKYLLIIASLFYLLFTPQVSEAASVTYCSDVHYVYADGTVTAKVHSCATFEDIACSALGFLDADQNLPSGDTVVTTNSTCSANTASGSSLPPADLLDGYGDGVDGSAILGTFDSGILIDSLVGAVVVRNDLFDAHFKSLTSGDLQPFASIAPNQWMADSVFVVEDDNTHFGMAPYDGNGMLCMDPTGGGIGLVRQDIDLTPMLAAIQAGTVSLNARAQINSPDIGAEVTLVIIPRVGIQGPIASAGNVNTVTTLGGAGWEHIELTNVVLPTDTTAVEFLIVLNNSTVTTAMCIDATTLHPLIDGATQVAPVPRTTLNTPVNGFLSIATQEAHSYLFNMPVHTPAPNTAITLSYTTGDNATQISRDPVATEYFDVTIASLNFNAFNPPSPAPVSSAPSLSLYGLIGLIGFLLSFGVWRLRRTLN